MKPPLVILTVLVLVLGSPGLIYVWGDSGGGETGAVPLGRDRSHGSPTRDQLPVTHTRSNDSAPSRPTALSWTFDNYTVTFTWSPPADDGSSLVSEYLIYRGVCRCDMEMKTSAPPSATTHSLILEQYLWDHLYLGGLFFYVTAVNTAGESPRSNIVNVSLPVHGTPWIQEGVANPATGHVTLYWSLPYEWDVIHEKYGPPPEWYHIYRVEGSSRVLLANVTSSSLNFTDSGAMMNKVYHYQVVAVFGDGEEALSGYMKVVTTPWPDFALTVMSGDNHVNLSWKVPHLELDRDPLYYRIYRCDQGDRYYYDCHEEPCDPLKIIANVSLGTNSTNVTSLLWADPYGEYHTYYVTVVYDDGESYPSNCVRQHHHSPVPLPPKFLTGTISYDSVVLRWKQDEYTSRSPTLYFRIYRGTSEGNEKPIAKVSGGTLRFKDNHADPAVTYSYYVTAVNEYGESPPSENVEKELPGDTSSGFWQIIISVGTVFGGFIVLFLGIRRGQKWARDGLMTIEDELGMTDPVKPAPNISGAKRPHHKKRT